jgi:hypothetical protein
LLGRGLLGLHPAVAAGEIEPHARAGHPIGSDGSNRATATLQLLSGIRTYLRRRQQQDGEAQAQEQK